MINDHVLDIIVEKLNLEERPKLQDTLLSLGADSMDLEEIRMECKSESGNLFPEEEILLEMTVAQLIKLVSKE